MGPGHEAQDDSCGWAASQYDNDRSLPSRMTTPLPWRLRLPVFAAPMFLVSGPDLVVAACKAGIIGAFPTTNARPIEELERWLETITTQLDAARRADPDAVIAPWCANLITHSSNTRLPEDLALIAHYKPPIVVTALGSPKPALEVVHAYGGMVIADVVNLIHVVQERDLLPQLLETDFRLHPPHMSLCPGHSQISPR